MRPRQLASENNVRFITVRTNYLASMRPRQLASENGESKNAYWQSGWRFNEAEATCLGKCPDLVNAVGPEVRLQ